MRATTEERCAGCGYENAADALTCGLCGRLCRDRVRTVWPAGPPGPDLDVEPRICGMPRAMFSVVLGAALAPLLAQGPILSRAGWFLQSLTHELGHTVVAWSFGMPAFPAIRLDGHAASIHREQQPALACAVWAALAFCAWRLRGAGPWCAASIAAVLAFPAFAFTRAGELLHLCGGHLGELAFAAICFWRALSGGFTPSNVERALYAMVGWFLVAANLWLCGGLATDPAARARYVENGSFGLTNDYIRVAEDVVGCSLQSVAAAMAVVALLPLPVAWLAWRRMPD